jgi:hypothetical protein
MYRLNCYQNYRLKVVLSSCRVCCPCPLVVALMVSMALLLASTVLVALQYQDLPAPYHHRHHHDCRQQD